MTDKAKLTVVPRVEEFAAPAVEVGQWYWVEQDHDEIDSDQQCVDGDRWFACVTYIGSNYVRIEAPHYRERIHQDEFQRRCTREFDAQVILDREIAVSQAKIQELMREVQALTARLAVQEALPEGGDTHALALQSDVNYESYKAAMEKAKNQDLPALFEAIKDANKRLTDWLTASAIPLRADFSEQERIIGRIDTKIFSVQLYAGLVEEVVQITDGKPAPIDEKLRVFQRKHFMDEECLLDYKAGGMEFKNLPQFDRWIKKKRNRNRILPFPRCCVAFQVRRNAKNRGRAESWQDAIDFSHLAEQDKYTFLYIRNGEKLYRLDTQIEFGEKIFPDLDRSKLEGKLWIHKGDVGDVIDQNRYDGMGEDYRANLKRYRANVKSAKKDAQYRQAIKSEWTKPHAMPDLLRRLGMKPRNAPTDKRKNYEPFDQSNLYYDDAIRELAQKAAQYNRIALVLQGIFDRSPVLHPHHKVKLWTPEGLEAAVELVFDLDRALHAAEKPDFEAYRRRLNETIGKGSITLGQWSVWQEKVAEREEYRRACNWRYGGRDVEVSSIWTPYGNPGPGSGRRPGRLARVDEFKKRSGRCVYVWERERMTHDRFTRWKSDKIRATVTVVIDKLFNVSAYTPGDYKQFFADPRTRQEYVKWAPVLFAAEDYHAGKVKVP